MSDERDEHSVCPRCEGPLDPLCSVSKTRGGASICVPCENDETIHQITRQPLPDPAHWPVPQHMHLCEDSKRWPVHSLMGGGNPYMFLWDKQRKSEADSVPVGD